MGGPWGEFMKRREVLQLEARWRLGRLVRQAVIDYEDSGKTSGSYTVTSELSLDEDAYMLQTFNIVRFIQTGTYTVCDSASVTFQNRMYSVFDDMTWKPSWFAPTTGQDTQGWPDIPGALLTGWHKNKWQQFNININWNAPDITLRADGGIDGPKSWPWAYPQWSDLFP